MPRRTLRGRVNAVLLQWFVLLVVVFGAVVALSVPGVRKTVTDDRLLLAKTIAQSFDATLAAAIQKSSQPAHSAATRRVSHHVTSLGWS